MSPNQVQLIIEAVNKFGPTFAELAGELQSMRGKVAVAAAEFAAVQMAAQTAFNAVSAVIKPAMDAIDQFNTTVVATAAQIVSFQGKKGNLGEQYQLARDYAEQLQIKMEEVDANTIASAQDLSLMTSELMKQRVLLDINNQKQIEGFTNIANAVAVVAQGYGAKEIQVRQEIRSLMQGQVDAQSQLAGQVNAMVGGGLKQKVELWKKEGTIIENIGQLLVGYAAASGDLSSLWSTIKSTMETIANQILRGGFAAAFAEIVAAAQRLGAWAKEHKADIQSGIHKAWLAVKGAIEVVSGVLKTQGVLIQGIAGLVGKVFDGWGMILYVVLPPLTDRFVHLLKLLNAITNAGMGFVMIMMDSVGAIGGAVASIAKASFQALSGDFEGAQKSLAGMMTGFFAERVKDDVALIKGTFIAMGEELNAMKDPFGEMGKRYDEYAKKFSSDKKIVATPPLGAPPATDDEIKKGREQIEAELKEKLAALKSNHDLYKAELSRQSAEADQLFAKGDLTESEHLQRQSKAKLEALQKDRELLEAEVNMRKEYQAKMGYGKSKEEESAAIKEKGAYRAELAKLAADIKTKNIEIQTETIKSGTIDIETSNKVAKARREGDLKAFEDGIKLRKEELALALQRGDLSGLEVKREELQLEKELVQAKQRKIQMDLLAGGVKTEERQKLRETLANLSIELTTLDIKTAALNDGRDWFSGMKRSIKSYSESIKDVGAQVEQVFTNAFKGMEDALTKFVMTGKLDFKSLADSIISDIIRMQIKASITGPLSGLIGTAASAIGAWLGGGSADATAGGTVSASGSYTGTSIYGQIAGQVLHGGGKVVPRFHFGGLAADEVPAILQTGERVLDRDHNALLERFANKTESSGGINKIELINQTGQPMRQRDGGERFDAHGMVKMIVLELMDTDPGFRGAVKGGY